MHPVFNAKKSDPEGDYVRKWLPQLAKLPVEYIHCPWEAPPSLLASAGVRLGKQYPRRVIIDLEQARVDSHRAVMEVRSSPLGRKHRSKNGAEWIDLPMPNGSVRRISMITRVDYREGTLMELADVPYGVGGSEGTGSKKQPKSAGNQGAKNRQLRDEIKTKQTAGQRYVHTQSGEIQVHF